MGSILYLYFLLMCFILINQEDRILLETFLLKSYCSYMKIHLIILKPNTIQILLHKNHCEIYSLVILLFT